MSVVSLDPTSGLLRLQDSLGRLLRTPSGSNFFGPSRATVFPPLNVFSDQDNLVVRAEVPGFKPEEIDVNLEQRRLTITGERKPVDFESRDGGYHRRERRSGRFSRSLQLPDNLDATAASAGCRDGILTVRIPKRPEDKPRKIRIVQG